VVNIARITDIASFGCSILYWKKHVASSNEKCLTERVSISTRSIFCHSFVEFVELEEFSKLIRKAGLALPKGVGFYTLRRMAATWAAQSGDPFAVQ
jgi:hypothetical protein